MQNTQKIVVREAVGVFDTYDELCETIKELGVYGFGRHQISIRGSDAAMQERFGEVQLAPRQLEDNPIVPRSPLIGPDELGVAQGVLVGASIYAGAVIAIISTGGLATENAIGVLAANSVLAGGIGSLLAWVLGNQYSKFFRKQAESGGMVLWVETPSESKRIRAEAILREHGAHDVHVHEMAIAA